MQKTAICTVQRLEAHLNFSLHDPSLMEHWRNQFGFDLISWVPLPRPISFSFYSKWIEEQRHGDMDYLRSQAPLKEDARNVFPEGKSVLVVGVRYKPHPEKIEPFPDGLRIASYAKGRDYHLWLAEKLKALCKEIKASDPHFASLIATDSKPFLERDLAHQAGLGWIGKNTCLIHPQKGSFFFIGEVLTNVDLGKAELDAAGANRTGAGTMKTGRLGARNNAWEMDSDLGLDSELGARLDCKISSESNLDSDSTSNSASVSASDSTSVSFPAPLPDFCGSCQRCLQACPTGALIAPRVLDARKCISYWTIEAKKSPPVELREKIGDLFFGCDICQDVCPWNEKVFRLEQKSPAAKLNLGDGQTQELGQALDHKADQPADRELEELRFFLTASNREMEKTWGHTPLLRARPRGLRRNAIIVATNRGRKDLRPEIERWKADEELGELATWALARLDSVSKHSIF